ncbi:Sensor histidine kinase RcsC [Methylobacterium crusticola]|uniref:histidine kinase n=1 Tax=Methylobacterium crusticola TaxID=1697972 RepID=A0ABQ4QZU4_9HYPH|nr:response regulator [Methylobacterium crusticola]GJD50151.1 Sensor histidine kinase RcsC [Methylobacterium crusticola]
MQERSKVSLRGLSAVALGLAALLGAAAVLAGLGLGTQDRRADQTRQMLRDAAAVLADTLDRTLYDMSRDVRLAAQNAVLAQPGASPEAQRQVLAQWRSLRPEYGEILLAAPDGRVVATASGRLAGTDASGRAWFVRGRDGAAFVEAAEPGGSGAGGRMVEVSAPVAAETGALRGVLAAQLDDAWAEQVEQAVRATLGAAGRRIGFTVLSAGGQVLHQSATDAAGAAGLVEGSASGSRRDEAGLGWLVIARAPADAAGLPVVPAPVVLPLLLGAVLLAAAAGWILALPMARFLREAGRALAGDGARPLRRLPVAELQRLAAEAAAGGERHRTRERALRDLQGALRRSKDRVQAFKTMAGWTCWEIDLAGGQVTWSDPARSRLAEATERAAGLDEILGRVHAEDRALLQLTMQSALEGEGPHDITVRTHEDGRERRLLMRFSRIDAAEGGARLHALSREMSGEPARALTAEPARPAAGQPLNPGPTDLAVERRRNDTMRRLTDGIVHDFNNALTVVMTSLSTLKRRQGVAPDSARLLDSAIQGAERGAGLTRRMVGFTRRETTALAQADVAVAVEDLVTFLRASVLPQARISLTLAADLPPVLCSERQFEIAVLNLAFEAKDAMPATGALSVAADAVEIPPGWGAAPAAGAPGPGRYVRLTLTNHAPSGPGRADGSDAVAVLLGQIGGILQREAAPDGGSAATLWFPAGIRAPDAAPRRPLGPHHPLRILVVEGDGLLRASVADALGDLGHAVTQAGSGLQAMEMLAADRGFDIMLADYAMPILSGLQLAAVVSLTNPTLDIVISAPRGHLPENARRFRHLDKPFRQADLARMVEEHAPAARAA